MKRIWKLQYKFADARIMIPWEHYSSWFIRSCAFKIGYCKKQHMYCFLLFVFIEVIIFAINPCGSYSRFVGAESCVKVYFESLESIRTNLWWRITFWVCQSYCNYFYCLIVCCLYFLENIRRLSYFSEFKMITAKLKKSWTSFN